jgi:hypothetical protein
VWLFSLRRFDRSPPLVASWRHPAPKVEYYVNVPTGRIGVGLSHEKSPSASSDKPLKKNVRRSWLSAKIEERMRISTEFCQRAEHENRAFAAAGLLVLLNRYQKGNGFSVLGDFA